jgi:hypothetical protein
MCNSVICNSGGPVNKSAGSPTVLSPNLGDVVNHSFTHSLPAHPYRKLSGAITRQSINSSEWGDMAVAWEPQEKHNLIGFVLNSRHPDPRRVWKGGPEGGLRDAIERVRGIRGGIPKSYFLIVSMHNTWASWTPLKCSHDASWILMMQMSRLFRFPFSISDFL